MNDSPSHTTPLLEAKGISRRFAKMVAVRDVNLCLYRGEVCGFLGLNGAGKTTSLRMLCGTLATDSGDIFIEGIDLCRDPQAARARLGFLPDTPPLYPELSVDEFLHYCARLRQVTKASIADSIARVKQQTGLASYASQRIGSLSRGYRQRLGIAQAIIHQPALVVLDEPTSGLDPRQIEEIHALIRSLGERAAVLLSSHFLAEVRAVCNRVVIIHEGVIAYQSTLDDASLLIRVRFRRALKCQQLLDIQGIDNVEEIADNTWLIDVSTNQPTVIQTLQRIALEQQWELVSLAPASDSLERTFFRITQAHTA